MRRRDFLKNIGLGAVAITVAPGLLKGKSAEKLNFIYILADDLGYGDVNLGLDELDAFKNPYVKTPNLARLAKQSIVFTHHYAAWLVCSASRAGLLTGRFPTRRNINLWINEGSDNGKMFLTDKEVTIAEVLKKSGYTTAVIGKWHLNNEPLETSKELSSQIITDAAIDWLKNKRDKGKPFFLYLPYDTAGEKTVEVVEYNNMYQTGNCKKDKHYVNVTYLDAQIGRVLNALDTLRLVDNIVVFFLGGKPAMSMPASGGPEELDEYWGCPRSYGADCPLHGQKRQLLEGRIRVPGMIRWPGHIEPRVSDVPNSTLDVMPTICELAGVQPPQDRALDGGSLVGLLLEGKEVQRDN